MGGRNLRERGDERWAASEGEKAIGEGERGGDDRQLRG